MILAPRWRKLYGDLRQSQGRMLIMVLALAVGLGGVATMASASLILTREISRNYLGTNPAVATFVLDRCDPATIQGVRELPGVAEAEAGAIIPGRIRRGHGEPLPLLLFAVEDVRRQRIGIFASESGAWPPPTGTLLLERAARDLVGVQVGDDVEVLLPGQGPHRLAISGLVHDPGLAPAWQEQTAYAYLTAETLAQLGRSDGLHQLKITLSDPAAAQPEIERTVSAVAGWLRDHEHTVGEIRIPPARQHPHQSQMTAILAMLLLFSALAFLLSSLLTATMVGGLLARQVRQIGIMKAIGGRTRQIAGIYLTMVGLIAGVAALIGIPAGVIVGQAFARVIAELLNFTIVSAMVPWWLLAALVGVAVLVPLLVALVPIRAAAAITVRVAIQDTAESRSSLVAGRFESWLAKWRGLDRTILLAIRNSFRRRGRLLFTIGLLAAAGAMFMAGLDVSAAWRRNLADAADDRDYQLEFRLEHPASAARLREALAPLGGIRRIDTGNIVEAAAARADGLDIVHTYPDGGHASFSLRALPLASLSRLRLLAGRRLEEGDRQAVVLNHMTQAMFPNAAPGATIALLIAGRRSEFRIVGIVREILTPAAAYTTTDGFALAAGDSGGDNTIRIAADDQDAVAVQAVARAVEAALASRGIAIRRGISENVLDDALSGHVRILIVSILFMAVLMATVGSLGMLSSLATSVLERAREFAIMRAIGARAAVVVRNVVAEGVFTGLLSWPFAFALSLPLASAIGWLVGTIAFRLPLPLVPSPGAMGLWFVIVVVGSAAASLYPAWRAARLTIREALTRT